jgi:hypothetical protein
MFKQYEKRYEDVFTSERSLKKCEVTQVTAPGFDPIEYQLLIHDTIMNFQLDVFDYLVKVIWLFQKFTYKGVRRDKFFAYHNHVLDGAFGVFVKRYAGYDNKFFTMTNTFNKVMSYLRDFFPDFNDSNPFEVKFEYPYKYVSFECLYLVYQMPERLELLAECERKQMTYLYFIDYVINYISSYNEEYGDFYELKISSNNPTYISCKNRRIKKYGKRKSKTSNIRKRI